MMQDFVWINYDRLQYLNAADFDEPANIKGYTGNSRTCSNALYTLLADRWKGDRVILIGERWTDEESDPLVKDLRSRYRNDEYRGNIWQAALSEFENMAKYFEDADRDAVIFRLEDPNRNRDTVYEEHKDDPDLFFNDQTVYYRYVINHTKREYYRRKSLKDRNNWFNPLSFLLISAEGYYGGSYGMWIGDSLEVTNDERMVESLGSKNVTMLYTYQYFLGSAGQMQNTVSPNPKLSSKDQVIESIREMIINSGVEDTGDILEFLDNEMDLLRKKRKELEDQNK